MLALRWQKKPHKLIYIYIYIYFFFFWFFINLQSHKNKTNFFFKGFQPMASAPDDSSLSSNQDTNQFLV